MASVYEHNILLPLVPSHKGLEVRHTGKDLKDSFLK